MMLSSFLRILALVLSFTGSIHCVTVTIANPVVNVTAGQSATLFCNYVLSGPITNNLLIEWSLIEAHTQQLIPVYNYQNGKPYTSKRFENRVTASNATSNATITISNMQPQDTGFYSCVVSNLPDPIGIGRVQLIVLVAPSTPLCNIQGQMALGHAVQLSCVSQQGMPRPIYTWNRVVNGLLKPINLEQENGVVTIGNMTKFEDGYYRCTASNSVGNVTCELDLHTGGEAGIIVAGVIGAVLLATIIFVIIWFLIAKKKKSKKHIANSEMKTIPSSAGHTYAVAGEADEPEHQNLTAAETQETKEFRDQPENVAAANGEVEDPAV